MDWPMSAKVERFNPALNAIVGMIEGGKSLLQGYVEQGLEQHIVVWKGKALPVVFSRVERHIVTVLPGFRMRKPGRC